MKYIVFITITVSVFVASAVSAFGFIDYDPAEERFIFNSPVQLFQGDVLSRSVVFDDVVLSSDGGTVFENGSGIIDVSGEQLVSFTSSGVVWTKELESMNGLTFADGRINVVPGITGFQQGDVLSGVTAGKVLIGNVSDGSYQLGVSGRVTASRVFSGGTANSNFVWTRSRGDQDLFSKNNPPSSYVDKALSIHNHDDELARTGHEHDEYLFYDSLLGIPVHNTDLKITTDKVIVDNDNLGESYTLNGRTNNSIDEIYSENSQNGNTIACPQGSFINSVTVGESGDDKGGFIITCVKLNNLCVSNNDTDCSPN
jgi:hypothetical protein